MLKDKDISNIYDRLADALGQDAFNSWFQDTSIGFNETKGALVLSVPTEFFRNWIKGHYEQDFVRACRSVLGKDYPVEYQVKPKSSVAEEGEGSDKPLFRNVPDLDRQIDMFVPDITEIAIKDDVHLMEIAPWSPQPRGETRTELVYENVNGMNIRIKSNPEYGLITALDYDLVLFMQSWLALEANEFRKKLKHNPDTAKPPQWFEPDIKDILLFARNYKTAGANQRERVQAMLERLKSTEVRIAKASSKKRRLGSFSLIGDWDILEESDTGNILKVRIAIPQWIYEGIVEAPIPTILTYDPDYFLLKKPFHRFLYRFCRVQSRQLTRDVESIDFPLSDIYARSGSRQAYKEFAREARSSIKGLNEGGAFFHWVLRIEGKREQAKLVISHKPLVLESK